MTPTKEKMSIVPGSRVLMHYTLSLEDGSEVDSSRGDEPLRFTLGDGTLIHGLEQALLGFQAGDQQLLYIEPQDGFGLRDEDNVHAMPRSDFNVEMELEPGTIVAFEAPNGEEVPGMIIELNDDSVSVDFNHPLAGHRLIFDIEILEVETTANED